MSHAGDVVRGGDLARAAIMAAFSQAVQTDSSPAGAHLRHGQTLAKNGDIAGAIAELGEAIRLDSKNAQAFRLRALAYTCRNDSDKAIVDWTSAIGLATAAPGRLSHIELFMAYRSRAALYEGKQQSMREIADLTRMIESYWKTPELVDALDQTLGAAAVKELLGSAYKLRAGAYHRMRQLDKAIEDLSFAIELDPDHAGDAYSARALLEQQLGRRERAVRDFQAALRLDPAMAAAREALARLGGEAAQTQPEHP